ncbi:MAG: histidine phosphatase family protein [Microscillaceae bacterium]|nr:histidine phosphatase family protein [Microscillaceae bacterium]
MASELYLIRHGQASFMQENYDRLTKLGHLQSQLLGTYLHTHGYVFDACWIGSLERHQSTYTSLREGYQIEGKHLVDAQIFEKINEHQAAEIHQQYVSELLEKPENAVLKQLVAQNEKHDSELRKEFLKIFFQNTRLWAQGKIHVEGYESFFDFKKRITQAYETLLESMNHHSKALVISSGGTIAMLIGILLGLDDEKIIELNWQIRNCSISEFSFSKGKFYLRGFNQVAHFEEKKQELLTYV